ncbi:MAG: cobalamin biosynthesis protein [Parvibaculaceae bacterium]|nr:cobalamin biosynthesis protein [Parvibaculaceae bacterium]
MIVAGIGCRKGCGAEEISALVREVLALAGLDLSSLGLIASSTRKRHEAGLLQAADELGVALAFADEALLKEAAPRCLSHSETVQAMAGVGSICEASALALAGPDAMLLGPRRSSAHASCALAAPALAHSLEIIS